MSTGSSIENLRIAEWDLDRLLNARRGVRERFGILIGSLGVAGSLLGVFLTSANAPEFSGVWLVTIRIGMVLLGLALGVCLFGLYWDEGDLGTRGRFYPPTSAAILDKSLILRFTILMYAKNETNYKVHKRNLRIAIFLTFLGTLLISVSLWYTIG